ncbi:hypothetical protein PVAP13_7NG057356 [Panicum virgatum]|uniref:Uncharacterized protein n=1 Tax=Panicum virgatum TaxID=38727 RepID=A0A8T0PXG7_PANVG|nr:hypothetical protein PVAP13_7NG057356 [Panicum virgatum]
MRLRFRQHDRAERLASPRGQLPGQVRPHPRRGGRRRRGRTAGPAPAPWRPPGEPGGWWTSRSTSAARRSPRTGAFSPPAPQSSWPSSSALGLRTLPPPARVCASTTWSRWCSGLCSTSSTPTHSLS